MTGRNVPLAIEKLDVEIHFRANIWFAAVKSAAFISDTLLNKNEKLIDSVSL